MIDEQLHEAVRQLDTATQRIAIPVPRRQRAAGPLQAVAAAIVIVVGIGAAWVISEGSTAEQPVGTSAVSSPDEPTETLATTTTSEPRTAGERSLLHLPLSDASWSVADPESVHEAGLAALEFDPLESGGAFFVLSPVDTPMSELHQLSALLPQTDQPTSAVAIGAYQALWLVYRAERDGRVTACVRVSPESTTCILRLDGGAAWTTGAPTSPEPALWTAPEGTAVVRFEDPGSTLWMIPIDDVVAFPWYFTNSPAHLTAFDTAGETIGSHVFDPVTGPMTSPYPGPADVDLMRALTQQGSAVIAFGQEVEADTRETSGDAGATPYGELRSVLLVLNDGRTVPAVIVGQGDIGFAVVWLGAGSPTRIAIPDDLRPDQGTIVDDDMIVVTRGVAMSDVIEWWNTYIEALP